MQRLRTRKLSRVEVQWFRALRRSQKYRWQSNESVYKSRHDNNNLRTFEAGGLPVGPRLAFVGMPLCADFGRCRRPLCPPKAVRGILSAVPLEVAVGIED